MVQKLDLVTFYEKEKNKTKPFSALLLLMGNNWGFQTRMIRPSMVQVLPVSVRSGLLPLPWRLLLSASVPVSTRLPSSHPWRLREAIPRHSVSLFYVLQAPFPVTPPAVLYCSLFPDASIPQHPPAALCKVKHP